MRRERFEEQSRSAEKWFSPASVYGFGNSDSQRNSATDQSNGLLSRVRVIDTHAGDDTSEFESGGIAI